MTGRRPCAALSTAMLSRFQSSMRERVQRRGQPIDVTSVARNRWPGVWKSFAADEGRIHLRGKARPPPSATARRLPRGCFQPRLIENAVRYNHAGGSVSVRVSPGAASRRFRALRAAGEEPDPASRWSRQA